MKLFKNLVKILYMKSMQKYADIFIYTAKKKGCAVWSHTHTNDQLVLKDTRLISRFLPPDWFFFIAVGAARQQDLDKDTPIEYIIAGNNPAIILKTAKDWTKIVQQEYEAMSKFEEEIKTRLFSLTGMKVEIDD